MGSLVSKTGDILSTLISTGADAAPNLFEVIFEDKQNEAGALSTSLRITNFVAPERSNTTVSLPYMGTTIIRPAPGSTVSNIQKFNLRIDKDYEVYKYLKSKLLLSSQGYDTYSEEKKLENITVNLLTVENEGKLDIKYTWQFINCFIIGLTPINMSYDSSGGLSSIITFSYQECIEK